MSQIHVENLTFYYEGSSDHIFDNVSFSIDTGWKLGFIGRNGKGKTTFLKLLLGKEVYRGSIRTDAAFDYFPYELLGGWAESCASAFLEEWKQGCEEWKVLRELDRLETDGEVLYRPFRTLSHGERTKVMLAVLFSGENDFLLIDEPTDHLDQVSRESVKTYLAQKKGFILVSHDRDLLDACINHVLVLNRQSIEVQNGNFSSWEENKRRRDAFARMENEKHGKEIRRLKAASRRTSQWADANERTKIGFNPEKEPDRNVGTRAYIGAKTKKMERRRKQMEVRLSREIEEKQGLLQDIETPAELKMFRLAHHKKTLVSLRDYGLGYRRDHAPDKWLFSHLNLTISQGERVFLHGNNGCGKSSLIKTILRHMDNEEREQTELLESGVLETASGVRVSYVSQDTGFLHGTIRTFCRDRDLDESLFCALLRQMGMERIQLSGTLEDFSQGQKKKVLLAAGLIMPAHLYIWDEPLNYMDVFSRMQIEQMILSGKPTMLIVEHDVRFREKIATKVIAL